MPVQTRLQLRRGTSAQWLASTDPLSMGEIGFDTTLKKFKIGDGTTLWSGLEWGTVLPSELSEIIDDRISSLIVAGSGITTSYDDSNNTLSISSPVLAGSGIVISHSSGTYTVSVSNPTITSSLITDFSEAVQDLIGLSGVTAGSGISVNYNDSTGLTTISLSDPTIQVSDITDISATAAQINYLSNTLPGTGVAGKAIILDANSSIININNLSTTGNVVIGGNLTINGTTTTVNSVTITVDDKNLELGSVASPSDITADGGGITLKGSTDKEFKWLDSSDSWTSSEHINLSTGSLTYKLNGTTVIGNNTIGANGYSVASGVSIDGGTP